MSVYWNKAYIAPKQSFDTTRKSRDVASLINDLHPPTPEGLANSSRLINALHTTEYLEALKTGEPSILAESNGFDWDQGIWNMAINSTAGILSAIDDAVEDGGIHGSLSSGLHHADDEMGLGYCTVNGLAVGAIYARLEKDLRNKGVLIIDFDAHCGGGTSRFLSNWDMTQIKILDLSTQAFDEYPPRAGDRLVLARPRNYPSPQAGYMGHVEDMLKDVQAQQYGLVLYNAGVDPYPEIEFDTLGERDRMVFKRVREWELPCVWMLAGGYSPPFTKSLLTFAHYNTYRASMQRDLVSRSQVVLFAKN